MERSHSGLVRTLGKRVYRKVSGVRIPLSPPLKIKGAPAYAGAFLFFRCGVRGGGFERRPSAKRTSEPTIWLAASASEAAFGGEEESPSLAI